MNTHPVDVYDYIYSWKDYKKEAFVLRALLNQYGVPSNAALLEVACGTGRYLEHFDNYNCIGIDLCQRSLEHAQLRLPKGVFLCENMVDFKLSSTVNVILCLFGAIGYLDPNQKRKQGLINFYDHLPKGGLLILEPWVAPNDFESGIPFLQTYQTANFKVARTVVPYVEQGCCVLEFEFLLSRAGWKVERFSCVDKLWLHSHEDLESDLKMIGFEIVTKQIGFLNKSPLYVCRKV